MGLRRSQRHRFYQPGLSGGRMCNVCPFSTEMIPMMTLATRNIHAESVNTGPGRW